MGTAAGTVAGTAWVHSRFASGAAALEIACDPDVAAAVLGFTPLTILNEADAELLGKLSDCVNAKSDPQELIDLASTIGISLPESQKRSMALVKQGITRNFRESSSAQLQEYSVKMQMTCSA